MTIFKNYIDIMRKRFPTVILYGLMLVILVLLFEHGSQSFALSEYDQSQVRIAVMYPHEDEIENTYFLDYIDQYCDVISIGAVRRERIDALCYGDVAGIVSIPEGFFESYTKEHDKTEVNKSIQIQSFEDRWQTDYIDQMIDRYLDYIQLYSEQYPDETTEMILKRVQTLTNTKTIVEYAGDEGLQKERVRINQSYQLLGFVLFACLTSVICTSMNSYRENVVYQKHLVTPISPAIINSQLLLGNIVYSFLYTVILLALKFTVSNVDILSIQTLLYWVNTFIYAICIILFAFLLSFWIRRKLSILVTANVIGIIVSIISGVFIRQEYLAESLKRLASLTPVYWYIYGNDLILKYSDRQWTQILSLLKVFGMQALFAGAGFSLIMVAFKLEKSSL